jgi:hypothetical protein
MQPTEPGLSTTIQMKENLLHIWKAVKLGLISLISVASKETGLVG